MRNFYKSQKIDIPQHLFLCKNVLFKSIFQPQKNGKAPAAKNLPQVPFGIPFLGIYLKNLNGVFYLFSALSAPLQCVQEEQPPEQEPEQVLLSGHPMHFCPLFLAFIMYATAPPTMSARTAIIIIFSIVIVKKNQAFVFALEEPLSAYSSLSCFSFLMISTVRMTATRATNAQPSIGIQTEPKLPPMKSVPKKNTRKPSV